jgi:hypothetical protein
VYARGGVRGRGGDGGGWGSEDGVYWGWVGVGGVGGGVEGGESGSGWGMKNKAGLCLMSKDAYAGNRYLLTL